jgi:hypothetical protein
VQADHGLEKKLCKTSECRAVTYGLFDCGQAGSVPPEILASHASIRGVELRHVDAERFCVRSGRIARLRADMLGSSDPLALPGAQASATTSMPRSRLANGPLSGVRCAMLSACRRLRFHDRWIDGSKAYRLDVPRAERDGIAAQSVIRDRRLLLRRWEAVVDAEARHRARASQWRLFTSLREPVR